MEDQSQKQNEEIDLLELFQRMGKSIRKGINWVINLIYQIFLLILRKRNWIAIFTIIGTAIGLLLFSLVTPSFESVMVARSNATQNTLVVDAIKNLSALCTQRNYNELARMIGTSTQNAAAIKSIGAFYGIDINADGQMDYIDYNNSFKAKKGDSTLLRLPGQFYVKITVMNEKVYPILTNGIKNFIAKDPFIAENNLIRKQQTSDMINSYNLEIKKLDSLQKSYYFTQLTQRAGNGQMLFLNEKEVKLFHRDVLALVKEKQSLERSLLVDPDPITVVQDFTPLNKVNNPWTKYVKLFGISFAFMGLFIGVFWEYKRNIWQFIKDAK